MATQISSVTVFYFVFGLQQTAEQYAKDVGVQLV